MNNINLGRRTFELKSDFLEQYRHRKVPFGFNGFGELVYMRTYSRLKENGINEVWWETVKRVVEGTYSIQKNHINYYDLGWDEESAQQSAEEMYDLMWNMKFLPPGRGLWAMGTDIIEKRGLFAALNNCAFVSTDDLDKTLTKPFEFLMDMSMLGVGVGFDVLGAQGEVTGVENEMPIIGGNKLTIIEIKKPREATENNIYIIEDSREGWVKSLRLLLTGYFKGYAIPKLDYSIIRPEGSPIKTFGGVSCGPEPLKEMHKSIIDLLEKCIGKTISITNIVDIFNIIGKCVVAGGVRRTAEISFGYEGQEYNSLKDYHWDNDLQQYVGPQAHRADFGWTSNNSIFATIGQDYKKVGAQTARNGEPGYFWLEQAQKYGRIIEEPNWKDKRAKGANPCNEQTLESFELCCLVETYPSLCDSLDEYKRVLKYAYLYAKTVTLGQTQWVESNKVMLRNRRIGTSMSGIVMAIEKLGIEPFRVWCEEGYQTIQKYDEIYSDWFGVPQSKKTTSVKPSGTISNLRGITPGIHFPEDIFCIRRIRIPNVMTKLIAACKKAGYKVEKDKVDKSTMVVEIPIKMEGISRTVDDVSIWEQTSLAAFLQKYWSDNQVSCTVTFKPDLTEDEENRLKELEHYIYTFQSMGTSSYEEYAKLLKKKAQSEADQIPYVLDLLQYDLKGISFLPKTEKGIYAQMPYEGITEEKYNELNSNIKQINFSEIEISQDSVPEKFCDSDVCII